MFPLRDDYKMKPTDHETHFTELIEEKDNVQLADCHKRYTDAPEVTKDSDREVMNQ